MMADRPELEPVYDPRSVEGEVYASWESSGAFRARVPAEPTHPDRTFTIVMPPPNVTGALHLGHALNNTLQDILIRYHRMRGFNTLWQPGTDHAGIATQAVVERRIREQEGKSRHELGREELVRRIWQWKDEYEARIVGQLKLLGCSADWDRKRFTLDDGLVRAVQAMFFNLFRDGLIFRGTRLVNWDTDLQTAVADDEVYHETVQGHFWHIKYPVIPNPDRDPTGEEPEFVVIATTRPETMLGDVAVAVHPDPAGAMDRAERKLADSLAAASAKERSELESRIESIREHRRTHLSGLLNLASMAKDGRMLRLPLMDREIPLILDEWADPLLGTGCVKITPAHDENDYEVGIRHQLLMINVMTPDGKIAPIIEPLSSRAPTIGRDAVPKETGAETRRQASGEHRDPDENRNSSRYAGLLFRTEAREKVVADLESLGLLESVEDREIEVGHSDRSKILIEPFLSEQWYVRTSDPPVGEPRASARADCRTHGEPRASARADVRSIDLSHGAALTTWTTYGTWLPGDQRGYVSRTPRPDGTHEIHNLPGESYDADDPQALGSATERIEGKPVHLSSEHARIVLQSVASVCEHHGIELLAVAVMGNHVHVLSDGRRDKTELLQLLKGNASRELGKKFQLTGSPRWWTKGGSVRFIKRGDDLTAAMEYVLNQDSPLALWSCDLECVLEPLSPTGGEGRVRGFSDALLVSGASFDLVESARAEARGSPMKSTGGLAQAAMDTVTDGRIRVFPERYAKTYLDWLGEKRNWCISRQLWWGHRIQVFTIKFYLHETAWTSSLEETLQEQTSLVGRCADDVRTKLQEHGISDDCVVRPSDDDCVLIVAKSDEAIRFLDSFVRSATDKLRELLRNPSVHDSTLLAIRSLPGRLQFEAIWNSSPHQEWASTVDGINNIVAAKRDEDVLDTWFSSALWPFSTLGWPSKNPENISFQNQYYPGSVLVTSRDIITNWVARMVMFGLYAMGDVPFRHVYVHPKILDGRGETMSKSKGNGVDPVDIIHTHGADALRYTMADMCTETQDIRMPVDYLCPHCGKLTDQSAALKAEEQSRKSRGEKLTRRLQPSDCARVRCVHKECGREFATQWADGRTKEDLGVARETSEKFEIGRNFCNKLWNAARYVLMNLAEPRVSARADSPVADSRTPDPPMMLGSCDPCRARDTDRPGSEVRGSLRPEDRWILAKLSQTIRQYHQAVQSYQFSASIKVVREYFWDCLCDWYVELAKPRLAGPREAGATEPDRAEVKTSNSAHGPDRTAREVLAFCLDQSLRLLHPTMPFITEHLWARLNQVAPVRGLLGLEGKPSNLLISAEFPPEHGYAVFEDDDMVEQFAQLQDAVRGVRDLRARCGVPPRQRVTVTVVPPPDRLDGFRTFEHIVRRMAGVETLHVAAASRRPPNSGSVTVHGLHVYVHDISDDAEECRRTAKAIADTERQVAQRETKLGNPKFVAQANPEVVGVERRKLAELQDQLALLKNHLTELSA